MLAGPLDVRVGALTFAPSTRLGRPVQSVNEVADPGGMADTVWLEEGLSVCEKLLCEGGSAPPTQEVSCVFWCCPGSVVIVALFVDFQWLVKISWRMGVLKE